jgi:hypothetical protein
MRIWKSVVVIVWLFSVVAPNVVLAWGSEGHQVIALIAEAKLTPNAKAEVERLLAQEPGQTLASVSTWADEHRNPATASWHYVNFPRDTCSYVQVRDCPDGKCVVGAIERQVVVLKSGGTEEKRLLALKYLVHLVGDVHQPLHAGYAEDRGGNTYQLQAFMRGSNLHALWDTGILKSLNEDVQELSARLLKSGAKDSERDFGPERAAEESCRIVGDSGFYPERRVGSEYIDKYRPIMENRLQTAGARLAAVLNAVFR